MLNKRRLKQGLMNVLGDTSSQSIARQVERIGEECVSFLNDGTVPGTHSSVTFPGLSAMPQTMKGLTPPAGKTFQTGALLANALSQGFLVGTLGATGQMNGAPIPPGTAIVSEVGAPIATPPLPALTRAFQSSDQTVEAVAESIASAVYLSAQSLLFTIIELVPSPGGPIPTPILVSPLV